MSFKFAEFLSLQKYLKTKSMEKIVEMLKKYSCASEQKCIEILTKNSSNFWSTLFELSDPEKDKEKYVMQLNTNANTTETIYILSKLEEIYGGQTFSKMKMSLYENDYSFFKEIGNPTGKESLDQIFPSSLEVKYYAQFLADSNAQIVFTTLRIVSSFSASAYTDELITQLELLMTGAQLNFANEAIRTTFDNQDKIQLFYESLVFNLSKKRTVNHFNTIRAFWSANAKIYDELTPLFESLAKSKNSQTRDMAQDVLIRYNKVNAKDIAAKESKMKQTEVIKISKKVATIKTAKALFTFVDRFNWDDDITYMQAVVKHDQCEIAIALMVYWRSCPTYYQQFVTIDEVEEYNQNTFLLQCEIEQKMEQNYFLKGKLKYDPRNDNGHDFTKSNIEEEKIVKAIPTFMFS
jgi:hypothetical protein